jgi:hypothetical protein
MQYFKGKNWNYLMAGYDAVKIGGPGFAVATPMAKLLP